MTHGICRPPLPPVADRRPTLLPTSTQSRYVWMTDADWRAFAMILRQSFPEARYWVSNSEPWEVTGAPMILQFFHDLFSAGGWRFHATVMVFDPAWKPDFVRYRPYPEEPEHLRWVIRNHALPCVHFHLVRWPRQRDEMQDVSQMGYGQITFHADPHENSHALLRRRFFRLLGKCASNHNQAIYRMPERELVRVEEKGSQYWIGHDAKTWALEDPRRMFFYNSHTWAFRPNEDATREIEPPAA